MFAECGAAALEQPVGQVMTRKVVTCNRAETVSSIMELMTAGKFRHLPVVEEGQLVGIVSIGDVVKHRVQEMTIQVRNLARLHPHRIRRAHCAAAAIAC